MSYGQEAAEVRWGGPEPPQLGGETKKEQGWRKWALLDMELAEADVEREAGGPGGFGRAIDSSEGLEMWAEPAHRAP